MQTEFHVIPSKPYFSINMLGDLIKTETGKKVRPYTDRDGYLRYAAYFSGKTKHIARHRAIAEVFVDNPNPIKFNIVNHKNGIRNDNRPENLEWVNAAVNRQCSDACGAWNVRGERHSQAKLTDLQVIEICKLLNKGEVKVQDIAEMYNVTRYNITSIKQGWSWRHIIEEYLDNCPPPRKPKRMKAKFNLVRDRILRGEDKETIINQFTPELQEKVGEFYEMLIQDVDMEYPFKW